MIYQIIALLILIAFYTFYFAKIIVQKKQDIKTVQMGVGNKPKKVLVIEQIMRCATVLSFAFGLYSIFSVKKYPIEEIRIIGIILGLIAVVFFAMATITMKSSWRVGIPEEKTSLITKGIYKWSRNPAFLGFDLLYLSMCLIFFNFPLLLVSVWAVVMLHIQILQEEVHMKNVFGEEYMAYKERTRRYLGRS